MAAIPGRYGDLFFLDEDGVPRVIQALQWIGHIRVWEVTLFNGEIHQYAEEYIVYLSDENLSQDNLTYGQLWRNAYETITLLL